MKDTILVGLDTSSTKTGWSYYVNGNFTDSGVLNFSKQKNSDIRMQDMVNSIYEKLSTLKVDIVAIETTAVTRNASSQRMLTMILGAVYGWCVNNNVEFVMFRPSEWRALISKEKKGRKRNELKQWSVQTVEKLFRKKVSDDEADAILIAQALVNKYE